MRSANASSPSPSSLRPGPAAVKPIAALARLAAAAAAAAAAVAIVATSSASPSSSSSSSSLFPPPRISFFVLFLGSRTRRSASLAAPSHTLLCCAYQCASIPEGRNHVTVCPCGGSRSSSATSRLALRHMTRRRMARSARRASGSPASRGAWIILRHHPASVNGDGPPRNAKSPWRSSSPRLTGVPVTAHRCVPGTNRAIAPAAAALLSTSCASSSTTRHHVRRVKGVGRTRYRRRFRPSARPSDPDGLWCRSWRSTSYVVSTTSASAKSRAETTSPSPPNALAPRRRFASATGPPASLGCPSYTNTRSAPGLACRAISERHCGRIGAGHTTSVAPHGPENVSPAFDATHAPHENGGVDSASTAAFSASFAAFSASSTARSRDSSAWARAWAATRRARSRASSAAFLAAAARLKCRRSSVLVYPTQRACDHAPQSSHANHIPS